MHLIAGLLLGLVDCLFLSLAAPESKLSSLGIALVLGLGLSLALAPVSFGLCHWAKNKARLPIARVAGNVFLLVPWLLVVSSLGSGAGIAASAWRIPVLLGLSGAGGVGLWFASGVGLASLKAKGLRLSLLLAACASIFALLYGTGFLYRESYQWLHIYLLLLALVALQPVAYALHRRLRWVGIVVGVLGASLLLVAFLSPSRRGIRAELYQHTQAGRTVLILESELGLGRSKRASLQMAMSQGTQAPRFDLPPCATRPKLNYDVIVLTIDAVRADRVFSAKGSTMPALAAMALEGVGFDAAYAPSPETSTSLVSILSGQSALALREQQGMPGTLASELQQLGYRTVSFFPFTTVTRRVLPEVDAKKLGFSELRPERKAEPVVRQIINSLSTREDNTPTFFYAHLLEPHAPYKRHAAFDFGGDMAGRYDSELAYVDAQLASLDAALQRLGRRDKTLIVVTADHGEAFFEHGVMAHGTTLYDEMIRVPLVFRIPGLKEPLNHSPVSLLDVAPTVLAALGCGFTRPTEGQSLLRKGRLRDRGGAVITRQYDTSQTGSRFVRRVASRVGTDKLIWDLQTDIAELYDLQDDPGEKHNRIDDDEVVSNALVETIAEARRSIGSIISASSADALPGLAAGILGGDSTSIRKAGRSLGSITKVSPDLLKVIEALEASPNPAAADLLDELAEDKRNPLLLRQHSQIAGASKAVPWALPHMLVIASSTSQPVALRTAAIEKLARLHDTAALVLKKLSQDADLAVAAAAATSWCRITGEAQLAAERIRRTQAADGLATLRKQQVREVMECLGRSGQDADAHYLLQIYRSDVSKKKQLAYENIETLARTKSEVALPLLIELSTLSYEALRIAGLDALGTLGTQGALTYLTSLALRNQHLAQAPDHFVALMTDLGQLESLNLAAKEVNGSALVAGLRLSRPKTPATASIELLLLEFSRPEQTFQVFANGKLVARNNPDLYREGHSQTVFVQWKELNDLDFSSEGRLHLVSAKLLLLSANEEVH